MTDFELPPEQLALDKSQALATDEIIAGGWDAVADQIRMASVRLVELAANIYVHRKPAMTVQQRRDGGLLNFHLALHIDSFVYLIGGFRPPKSSSFELKQPEFDSPFDSVRDVFPSGELIQGYIRTIDLSLIATADAIEVMSERAGMPIPSFEQLAAIYMELARLESMEEAVKIAAKSELTVSALTDADLFGVGMAAAPIINRIIPPRCVPDKSKITLPMPISLDHATAAHLLERFVIESGPVYFESCTDESFDAAVTHTTNHATVAVGTSPFHSPNQLCFDNRALEQPTTNTELVVAHAIKLGTPLDFTDGMVRFAQGDKANEYQFESDMTNTFHEVCGSTSLAMKATNLLLRNRFKTSDAFKEWTCNRNTAYIKSLPEYQKYAPKPEQGLRPMPGIARIFGPWPQ